MAGHWRPEGDLTSADAAGRAHHRAFDALGPLDAAPAGCDLVNIPELVPGPKKGDDDKRACKAWLDELTPRDAPRPRGMRARAQMSRPREHEMLMAGCF